MCSTSSGNFFFLSLFGVLGLCLVAEKMMVKEGNLGFLFLIFFVFFLGFEQTLLCFGKDFCLFVYVAFFLKG